jgi:hypothetical protein
MITLTVTYTDGTEERFEAYKFECGKTTLAVYDDVYACPAKIIIPLFNVKKIDREIKAGGDNGRVAAYTWETYDDLAIKNSMPPWPEMKEAIS